MNQLRATPNRKSKPAAPSRNRADRCDVLLTGTGSLSQAILLAWPTLGGPQPRLRVVILSRSQESAHALAILANFRAAAAGCELDCRAAATNWEEADLQKHFAKYRPRLILHAASLQSPWPKADDSSPWRQIMRGLGFGVSTPLQAALAVRVGRAVAAVSPESAFVNCCYPDAVNPLLGLAGLPITCGAGNVSIIAAVWRSRMPSNSTATATTRILAHHAQLTQLVRPAPGGVYPRVWVGNTESGRVRKILGGVEFPPGKAMNHLTGTVTAKLAQALLGRVPVHRHAPGPAGLVGGYPVLAHSGRVTLDLPRGVSVAQAVAFNQRAQVAEGIESIDKRGLKYTPALAAELCRRGSRFSDGFPLDQIEAAADDMATLRQRLGGSAP